MKRKVILVLVISLFGMVLVACDSGSSGLREIGNEEFAEIVNSENEAGYWVYIGRPTCEKCREMKPNLEEVLEYLAVPMYYFQTAKARYADEDRMLELLEPLDIEGIPIIVHLINGRVANYLIGVYTQEEIIDFIKANGGD